jgi:hypothetical protein
MISAVEATEVLQKSSYTARKCQILDYIEGKQKLSNGIYLSETVEIPRPADWELSKLQQVLCSFVRLTHKSVLL